ncbi:MAG: hypothetical protein OXC63_08160 [Aestuariivita sp.]|nr:hypothetical protein [Aestuariivita sp.]MCY4345364.1 hypothetical protein [Aestuariivita sp.]
MNILISNNLITLNSGEIDWNEHDCESQLADRGIKFGAQFYHTSDYAPADFSPESDITAFAGTICVSE